MIRTERLLIRSWDEAAWTQMHAINADPVTMQYFPEPYTQERSDALRAAIEENFAMFGYGLWAVEIADTGELIGFTGMMHIDFEVSFCPNVEIGWRIAQQHWGQGYATEAALAALAFGFEAAWLDEVVSFTVPQNIASTRVMQKIGMARDPLGDFDHPKLPTNHELSRHVLYRMTAAQYQATSRR